MPSIFLASSTVFLPTPLSPSLWVNNVHISNIETGKKAPSIDLLIELANALGISTDDLLVDSLTHSVSTADSEIHSLQG